MRVLLTRPAAQSRMFAEQLRENFGDRIEVVESPVLRIEMLKPTIAFDRFDAFVFTSQNGVAAFEHLGGPAGRTAYCVGERTAAAADAIGLNAVSADGDIEALAETLKRDAVDQKLLHVSGTHVAGELGGTVSRVAAYTQKPIPLSAAAKDLLLASDEIALPFFSPRSASLFQAGLPDKVVAPLRALCLSPAVAAELEHARFRSVQVCERPKTSAMMRCLSELLTR